MKPVYLKYEKQLVDLLTDLNVGTQETFEDFSVQLGETQINSSSTIINVNAFKMGGDFFPNPEACYSRNNSIVEYGAIIVPTFHNRLFLCNFQNDIIFNLAFKKKILHRKFAATIFKALSMNMNGVTGV